MLLKRNLLLIPFVVLYFPLGRDLLLRPDSEVHGLLGFGWRVVHEPLSSCFQLFLKGLLSAALLFWECLLVDLLPLTFLQLLTVLEEVTHSDSMGWWMQPVGYRRADPTQPTLHSAPVTMRPQESSALLKFNKSHYLPRFLAWFLAKSNGAKNVFCCESSLQPFMVKNMLTLLFRNVQY